MSVSVAIVGAGMAGVAAAQLLASKGVAVEVFDKSRGTGGRMASKRIRITDAETVSVDIGAQYFRASSDAFKKALRQWQLQGWIKPWWPKSYRYQEGVLSACQEPGPFWLGYPRMSALTRNLLGDTPLHSSSQITELLAEAGQWRLQDATGARPGPYSHVIIAAPAPQASILLSPVADLANVASQIPLSPAWVVVLAFDMPLATAFDRVISSSFALESAVRHSVKPGREAAKDIWVLQAAALWSQAHKDMPADQVINLLSVAFAEVLGSPLPNASFALAHRWLYAQASNTAPQLLADQDSNVFACGDWCHPGGVEGAWLSGRRTAEQLMTSLER